MIIQKETRDVINEICKEFDLPFEVVREIIYSQFKYTKNMLESGIKGEFDSFHSILLKYLGTFYISEGRFNYINNFVKGEKK